MLVLNEELLEEPDADKFFYRLYNNDTGCPVGHLGPSVAFTVRQAQIANDTFVVNADVFWVRVGPIIYSVE